ncbi:MAG: valine--tRNA ligase [Cyanobacteria bacterium QH_2_48_84]|nr:MAG: valine--tRNA ligase [Cyanobacteria bacterium QH_2_48_84]
MTATTPSLPSQYHPSTTEAKWQKFWKERQVFQADPSQGGKPYSIVIPPPNVTGSLHMGHAFNTALIDVLVRYYRMRGYNTLCLPGTDHASIAVQAILDKQLQAEGTSRYEIGREQFLERAMQWKTESGGQILNQLQRLGLSADWSRERFTMDEGLSEAVRSAFVQLYEQGLIYRGKYLVNWCPATQSALSDLEVENKEEAGKLWQFRYPFTDGSGAVEVATTRPETMLGDTAVAVNPQDERYQDLIGKTLKLPLIGREIPVISDEMVDASFGTGCVKVTPAHDPNDFEMGQRHQLPFVNIMNLDGTLNENAGQFAGEDRFVARENVVQQLEEEGLLVKVKDYGHIVPYSDRGKVPVEPLLSTQWFLKIRPIADRALAFLDQENSPLFVPERWKKVYRDWLVKLKDWCISRQLWWGHQIPAWYVVSETGGEITDETPFIVAHSEAEAQEKALTQYGENVKLEREADALDTWFSSGLWPFSTLGWSQQTADLETYYPTSTLVTGFDIIFFWVARMTMLGGHFTGEMPFQDVYIHGLVRDENGKKMSKSAGNGIDPLLLMDKYGTDALRYTLVKEVTGAGQDISLEYNRETDESASVEASRNFANKLWNAARFVIMNLDGQTPQQLGQPATDELELADRWILLRFQKVTQQTRNNIEAYGLGEAAQGLYDFIWGEFCDWYIELVKSRLNEDRNSTSRQVAQQTLAYVLEGILKLLHPFMPHITEEIWHTLTQETEATLALQSYPEAGAVPIEAENRISVLAPHTSDQSQTQRILKQVVRVLFELPEGVNKSFGNNRQPLRVAGWLLLAIVIVEVVLAALSGINNLPILSPAFQLLGFGYTVWFIYRYLLRPGTRQELREATQQLKEQVVGQVESGNELGVRSSEFRIPSSQFTTTKTPLEEQFDLIIGTIRTIRNLRAEADVKPGAKVPVILQSESKPERQILEEGYSYIQDLGKVEPLTIVPTLEEETGEAIAGVTGTVQVLIPLTGIVDIDALRAKLEKNLNKVEGEVNSLTARLDNPNFVNKAPAEVVQGARDALAEAQKQQSILQQRLTRLQ